MAPNAVLAVWKLVTYPNQDSTPIPMTDSVTATFLHLFHGCVPYGGGVGDSIDAVIGSVLRYRNAILS
jgi:hypothetical protein